MFYPKIPGSKNCPNSRCIAFEKYDGTNLHWVWDRDFGWHSFGTRRDEFDFSDPGRARFRSAQDQLHESVALFLDVLAAPLERVFHDQERYRTTATVRVFTEFFGPNSFAGLHKTDDPKQLVLFDVSLGDFGIIGPGQFVLDFGKLPIAKVVYQGRLTGKFADDVRKGRYPVSEGVVCKGGQGGADLWMAKIKTDAYMQKLKTAFAERWEDYWE